MIIRPREYLDARGLPGPDMLSSVLAEHRQDLSRLDRLKEYYSGRNAIAKRKRSAGLPNNRISHAFARYITAITSGYLVGEAVSYASSVNADALNAIMDCYLRANIAAVDSENARNASIFGRGVEYVYVDEAAQPRVSALDPREAFVVYDDTHESRPLFGVYAVPRLNAAGKKDGMRIWVMGERFIQQMIVKSAGDAYEEEGVTPHFFGGVPLVEYWNDEDERGDFEWVITQIDAYDILQSDRLNDKEQYVNRLLLLYGCTLDKDERGREPWQQLREDKALSLPDTDSKAEYLGEAMDEAGNEILRNNIAEDIHKLSMVPDLSDKNFAANASGVAMKYKLFGLEQLTKIKEQWFREGLKTRLKLFAHFMQVRGSAVLDTADVKISFTRAMPANLLEIAQTIQAADAAGAMSTETKVRTLHDGDEWTETDIAGEVEAIRAEERAGDPANQFGNLIPGNTEEQLLMQGDMDDMSAAGE